MNWQSFVDEWKKTLCVGAKESCASAVKRAERTDEVLGQRKEEARAAKMRKKEKKERMRVLEEGRANGSVQMKMTPQQLQNRKMKEAYENSVKRRASFYEEVINWC